MINATYDILISLRLLLNFSTVLLLISGSLVILSLYFLAKHVIGNTQQKLLHDKALLKKLLDDFGLEIPAELQENEVLSIKITKSN